jgi:hypothetical protein
MLAEIIGLFLIVWLLLSVLNQFSFSFFETVAQHDKWALLPRWTFFAPNPGCTDFRVVYRTFDELDQPSAWREVPMVRKRVWSDAIWCPDKRAAKALIDLTMAFRFVRRKFDDPTMLITTIPYIALVHYLDRLLHFDQSAKSWQFMIIQTHGIITESGPDIPDILVRSQVHHVRP